MMLRQKWFQYNVNIEFSRCLAGWVSEPTLGMEFSSEEDARNYYNAYANQTGFSICVNFLLPFKEG